MDVKTAGRTVELFELFALEQSPLSLSQVARALGAPVSSCFNLVRALERRGYLYGVSGRRLYPTRKLFDLGRSISAGEPWMERFEPTLWALRESTQETAILGKRQDDQAIYLAVAEGPQNVRYSARPGDLKPLHSSSIGKALLISMEPAERKALIATLPLEPRTPASITDAAALLDDLAECEKRGFTETRGENVADVMAIAKPVRLEGEVYAIAVAGPMHRMLANATHHRNELGRICQELAGAG
jgi:IclR family transcriptional regulator, acetate operon repressor